MLRDFHGLAVSSADAHSLARFEDALGGLFLSDGTVMAVIDRALARDPAFAVGHCLRAGAWVLAGSDASADRLAATIAAILVARHPRQRT